MLYDDQSFLLQIENLTKSNFHIDHDALNLINQMTSAKNNRRLDLIYLVSDEKFTTFLIQYLKNDYNLESLSLLSSTFYNFSHSSRFCKEFLKLDGLKILFVYVNDSNFVNLSPYCVSSILFFIVNLARLYNYFKPEWLKEKGIESLVTLGYRLKNDEDCLIICYLAICLLMEHEQIRHTEHAIEKITRLVDESAQQLESNRNIKRNNRRLLIENRLVKLDLVFILECLYDMLECDLVKEFIYFVKNIFKSLDKIVLYGNQYEKFASIKLFSKLCLSDKISNDIISNFLLLTMVERFANSPKTFKQLKEFSNLFLWTLKVKKPEPKNLKSEHIMISYFEEDFDFCKKLKDDLIKEGNSVWDDVSNDVESKFKTIEDSKYVLVCLSKGYKLSHLCRLEAEYALRLNKPIIFLLIEQHFKPDGWLGPIWEKIDSFDFTNYEKGIINLKEFLNFMLIDSKSCDLKKVPIEEWSEKKVSKWLIDKKINPIIYDDIYPIDGKILCQIHEILINSPECFYSALKSYSFQDIAFFVSELRSLFNKS